MTRKRIKYLLTCTIMFHAFVSAFSAEYFVSKNGDDRYDGRSEAKAFGTIEKGVSALRAGDVLTICPGEYFESVTCSLRGEADAPIVIRAKRPHTAIIRGDEPLIATFEKVPGSRFTYVCDEKRDVKGVLDRGFLCHYSQASSIEGADQAPGQYFYDGKKQKLYLHTSNSRNPREHNLTLAGAAGEFGLYIRNTDKGITYSVSKNPDAKDWVRHILIEGLVVSGFAQSIPDQTRRAGIGLGAYWPKDCVIRDCVAFLNATGIEFTGTKISRDKETALKTEASANCVIERCVGYGNNDGKGSGAAILCRGSIKDSVIRDCVAFKSSRCLRFYSGVISNCLLKNNIAFSAGDIWEKFNFNPAVDSLIGNVCERLITYSEDSIIKRNLTNCLTETKGTHDEQTVLNENIITSPTEPIDLERNFAAPEHLDYRLQSDSQFRGQGRAPYPYQDEVFYVKPDGDDEAAGTSVEQAWKTLAKACENAQPGHTVYIMGGEYDETLIPKNSGTVDKPIIFSERGDARVIVKGVILNGKSHLTLRGLTVLKGDQPGINLKDGERVTIEQCVVADCAGAGVQATNLRNLTVRHSALSGNAVGVNLEKCQDARVSATIFNANSNAAIRTDKDSLTSLWTNYNSFNDDGCFIVSDGTVDKTYHLDAWRRAFKLGEHSLKRTPEFDERFYLKNCVLFNGYGPLGMPVGPYRKVTKSAAGALDKLHVRSTTSSTANIECFTPGAMSNCELRWGIKPECENRVGVEDEYFFPFTKGLFHTFSLTGLTPGQHYFFRIVASSQPEIVFSNEPPRPIGEGKATRSELLCFTTPMTDTTPRTFHVSPSGDDQKSGLSRKEALRTISAAVEKTKAGDTVIVADGEYRENIVVRATGDKDAPIVIKAENPGKAVLFGDGIVKSAFELWNKHWILVDGFYIRDYAYFPEDISGAFSVIGGSNNSVRRTIFDGRPTCPRYTFVGKFCPNLTIENCVFRNAWQEINAFGCPNFNVRNNVFYGNMVGCIRFHNGPDQKFILSHNVICDQVPKKRLNALVSSADLKSLVDEYNCFFTRLPEDEKTAYRTKKPKEEKMTFAEFKRRTGQGKGSFFANPGMPIIKEYEIFQGDMTGRPHKFVTQELDIKRVKIDGKTLRIPNIVLFDQFFASNPKCVKAEDGRPIGLDPKAFEDVSTSQHKEVKP